MAAQRWQSGAGLQQRRATAGVGDEALHAAQSRCAAARSALPGRLPAGPKKHAQACPRMQQAMPHRRGSKCASPQRQVIVMHGCGPLTVDWHAQQQLVGMDLQLDDLEGRRSERHSW